MTEKSGQSTAAACRPSSAPCPGFRDHQVELLPFALIVCPTLFFLLSTAHEFHYVVCPPVSLRSQMPTLPDILSSWFSVECTRARSSASLRQSSIALQPLILFAVAYSSLV